MEGSHTPQPNLSITLFLRPLVLRLQIWGSSPSIAPALCRSDLHGSADPECPVSSSLSASNSGRCKEQPSFASAWWLDQARGPLALRLRTDSPPPRPAPPQDPVARGLSRPHRRRVPELSRWHAEDWVAGGPSVRRCLPHSSLMRSPSPG